MFAGYQLCFTIMFGGQSSEMMLEVMNSSRQALGLQAPIVLQLGLFFALLKWGGYILAFSNLACGAYTVWAAYLRSHLLSFTKLVVNFVFFFVNAVAFCAMLFEFATLRVVCNYPQYPMVQSERAQAQAAFFCTIKPQFMFVWLLVALLALIHFVEFFVNAVLFHQEYCRPKHKTVAMVSARSIDSLPPKSGLRR